MKKKISVGVLFGGRSAEHEVSLQSAKNIIDAIDRETYDPIPIGIDKDGKWYLFKTASYLLNSDNPSAIKLSPSDQTMVLAPWKGREHLVDTGEKKTPRTLDVIFPVLHGPFGEDGTIQGLLKLANIPFVGSSVLGSAVGMDKEVMKRLLRDGGIPVTDFLVFRDYEKEEIDFDVVVNTLGLPFFVKPANLGSSVGVSKVEKKTELKKALDVAFTYDRKILIEAYVKGREVECAVLGNDNPKASVAGEIIPHDSFYSYKAKYIDEKGATLQIPADISDKTLKKIQDLAIRSFRVLQCEGMARVDFFLTQNNKLIVNEINTIPGFTKISMYPKLWEESGIGYTQLIDILIKLARERFVSEQKLKTRVTF